MGLLKSNDRENVLFYYSQIKEKKKVNYKKKKLRHLVFFAILTYLLKFGNVVHQFFNF